MVLVCLAALAAWVFEQFEQRIGGGGAAEGGSNSKAAVDRAGGPSAVGVPSSASQAYGVGDGGHHDLQHLERRIRDGGAGVKGVAASSGVGAGAGGGSGGGSGGGEDPTFGIKTVGVFHDFKKPPWGGGNQFLMALVKEFRRRKIKARHLTIIFFSQLNLEHLWNNLSSYR